MSDEDPIDRGRAVGMWRVFATFVKAKGAVPIIVTTVLVSFAIGSTVGVGPDVLSDRYSRINHGYVGPPCSSLVHNEDGDGRPRACDLGSDDAQDASAWSSLLQNILTLWCNPVLGSYSDVHGRRPMLVWSVGLYTIAPIMLVLLQYFDTMNPGWYYLSVSLIGIVNYLSMTFATLSDVIPEEFRAAAYAIVMAGFYFGLALAPSLALLMSHFHVSVLASMLMIMAFLVTITTLPETLPEEIAERNRLRCATNQEEHVESSEQVESEPRRHRMSLVFKAMTRPLREISILNRTRTIKLVAMGSFFSSMVYSADVNLVIYYIEDQLDVRDKDIAKMFLVIGILGVSMQAVFLQPLIQLLGEQGLLVTSFISGVLHNSMYGAARDKLAIYVALSFSQLTKINFPLLSSFASKGATANEQGQVQGALFALNALSAAIGPLIMQCVYEKTKDIPCLGPGFMFYFAAAIYSVGTVCVALLFCMDTQNLTSTISDTPDGNGLDSRTDLEEPLLPAEPEQRPPTVPSVEPI